MKGRYFIRINGQRLPENIEIANTYFEYENDDELMDRLVLRFNDPHNSLMDSGLFKQGNEIEFRFGQDESRMSEARKHTIRQVSAVGGLTVTAYEETHRIAQNSRSRIYADVTIEEVAAFVARENGLQFSGDSFPVRYKQLAQVNETDMKFLKRLGKKVGALVYRKGRTLVFERRKYEGQPVASFIYDVNGGFNRGKAMNFQPAESNLGKPWEITMVGMNPMTMEVFETKSNDSTVKRGVLGEETLLYNGATGTPPARAGQTGKRIPSTAWNPLQAKAEGDAIFQSYEANLVKGTVTLWGEPDVDANTLIELKGQSERLTGLYRVKKARHIIQGSYKILATVERNATGNAGGQRSSGNIQR